ncbi:zinc-binding dehydrogenase [Burkholderia lata]|uniref:zinc-binding dehydrogenase n=1 Tax=Burkholderia lata (strain ATCC 17760 / DSM 23089 / LMG 22485 / NCIMB 9086 / R18194 / 383) TaxID=482957 RepID=UPI00399B3A91
MCIRSNDGRRAATHRRRTGGERAKRFIVDGLAAGALKPLIDRMFAFDDIVEAHRYMEAGAQVGKIVVTV